jgi:hypothetical protein
MRQQHRAAVLALACLVGGCQTAGDVLRNDQRLELDTTKPPQQAAHCVLTNAERVLLMINNTTSVTMRPGSTAGAFEVVSSSWGSAYSVVTITPLNAGSRMAVFHRPNQPVWGTGSLATQLLRGC